VSRSGLRFDRLVPAGGYAWWYIDALSDDGRCGLTLIVFVGSVFSPYYAWARRRGAADPLNHCAFNIALYGTKHDRWAMTERGSDKVKREEESLSIGPSNISWTGDALEIELNEICAPLPRRIQGSLRLIPSALADHSFELGSSGRHRWCPFAPCARIEVGLREPDQTWTGEAYLDSNFGDEPLEQGFESWTWSRANLPDSTVVLYDYLERGSAARSLALRFDRGGGVQEIAAPPEVPMRSTAWGVKRQTRADAGARVRVRQTLEDGPFYGRTLLDTQLLGMEAPAFHETISLDRFGSPWVQCLLPFRMPRSPW
jgi:carotenoid 1,2-hydratase